MFKTSWLVVKPSVSNFSVRNEVVERGSVTKSQEGKKTHVEGLLIPVSGVDDTEGRVREQVGEERIAMIGRDGTPKKNDLRWNDFA